MKRTKIPENLLQKFKNSANGDPTENIHTGVGFVDDILENLEDTCKWGAKSFDDWAKSNDLPGTGKLDPGNYGELVAIFAKRNMPKEWLKRTPEGLFVLATVGIAWTNISEAKRQRQKKEGQKDNE